MNDETKFFNCTNNREKALSNLIGILRGIDADKTLNKDEINYLSCWLDNQSDFTKDGDFIAIEDTIFDILDDGIVTSEELEYLQQLIRDVSSYALEGKSFEALVNQCIGFIQGISCDNKLNDQEILKLLSYLESVPSLETNSIIKLVITKLKNITEDGIISETEREDLLTLLKQVTGQQFLETGLADSSPFEFISSELPFLSIKNLNVCFTGTFNNFSRSDLKGVAEKHGANVLKGITKKLNLLVIGGEVTKSWRFSSFGRKIEKVIEYKEKGIEIYIIDERNWSQLTK